MTAEPTPPAPQPVATPARPRLDSLPPEDVPEIAGIALGLYEEDLARREDAVHRRLALEAAEEAGVPTAYMERAAALLHERRVAEVRRRRRRRTLLLGAGAAAVLVLAAWWGGRALVDGPAAVPVVERFDDAPERRWMLDVNPESRASLSFQDRAGREGVAVIAVERFGVRQGDDTFFVNLDSVDGDKDLSGLDAVTFGLRGDGLAQVRLYLERGGDERWRSPPIPVTAEWREQRVPLDQFERQERDPATGGWRVVRSRDPGEIDRLSFKVGHFVNDATARGEVAIDDLRVE